MLSAIPCGDLELNLAHPHGTPTLVPSEGLEQRLDLRLDPHWGQNNTAAEPPTLAVHLHVHYLDTLKPLLEALERCEEGLGQPDLWVSTDSSEKAAQISAALQSRPWRHQIRVCNNRGRNLGPLLTSLWPELKNYSLVLHLHGKRSVETDLGTSWLQELLSTLLPDNNTVKGLRHCFVQNPNLGLVMPQAPALIRPYLNWGNNFELAQQLIQPFGAALQADAVLLFPAGMMVWCRPAALAPLAELCQALPELPPEPLPVDGTSLHAMERLVAHSCEQALLSWKLLCREAPPPTIEREAKLRVWKAQPHIYLQATRLMAQQLRHEMEARGCAETNLHRCNQQLQQLRQQINSGTKQLEAADQQIRQVMQQVADRDQRLNAIKRSWSWKLTRPLRWLRQRLPAGT